MSAIVYSCFMIKYHLKSLTNQVNTYQYRFKKEKKKKKKTINQCIGKNNNIPVNYQ